MGIQIIVFYNQDNPVKNILIYRIIFIFNMKCGDTMTLEKLIELIKRRPGIFFGNEESVTIEAISHFLRGFRCGKGGLVEEEPFEIAFREKFPGFIYEKFNFILTKFTFWHSIIRDNSENEKDAVNRFFELFDEFREKYYTNTL